MKRCRALFGCLVLSTLLLLPTLADAFFLDLEKTVQFKGMIFSQLSVRTEDSKMWTRPYTEAGDVVQHRNLVLLELEHDLRRLRDEVPLFSFFKWAGLDAKYRLVGRFVYDGVFDYGPGKFRDVKDEDKALIEDFQLSSELWEAYLDLSRGPWFFRLGRQNLSWGETDAFRILDLINPIDNTFGTFFEPLDDRRIPLWMLRGSLDMGTHGPLTSLGLEAFWVPGSIDNTTAPLWRPFLYIAPDATPYAVPQPEVPFPSVKNVPGKKLSSSRYGARVTGVLFDNLGFTLAHFFTFTDEPMLRTVAPEGNLGSVALEMSHNQLKITGASINYYEPNTDFVIRSEVAMSWDEPVFIREQNMALAGEGDYITGLFPGGTGLTELLASLDLPWPGLPQPGTYSGGTIPERDILRWMVGLDKFFWLRALNRTNTFLISGQWFSQLVLDWDESLGYPIATAPDDILEQSEIDQLLYAFNFSNRHRLESNFTLLLSTMYWNGRLIPEVVTIYDARGAWYVQPKLTVGIGPWRISVMYNTTIGKMADLGVGVYRDRDQVAFKVTYQID